MARYQRSRRVKRIHADSSGVHILHDDQSDYKYLPKSHDNYNALYALAYIAASEKRKLMIRTKNDGKTISYVYINY